MPVAFADSKKSIYDESEELPSDVIQQTEEPVVSKPESSTSPLSIKTETIGQIPVKSSKFLEENIEVVRKWLYEQNKTVQAKVDDAFQNYLHAEKGVTSTVASLKAENEDILPGGIYILIATLSGSIFARRRGFLLRTAAPVVFGVAAFNYFLPNTYKNTGALIWSFEQKSPAIADAHVQVQSQIDNLASSTKSVIEQGETSLESGVHTIRQFVADTTGIDVGGKNDKKK